MACVTDVINAYLRRPDETNRQIVQLLGNDGQPIDHFVYLSDQVLVTGGCHAPEVGVDLPEFDGPLSDLAEPQRQLFLQRRYQRAPTEMRYAMKFERAGLKEFDLATALKLSLPPSLLF